MKKYVFVAVFAVGAAHAQVDINSASEAELRGLSFGLSGPEAEALIAYRSANGPIRSEAQLRSIPKLSSVDVAKLKSKLPVAAPATAVAATVSTPTPTPIKVDVNTATEDQLRGVAFGLSGPEAKAVIAYRRSNGPITSAAQLKSIPQLSSIDVVKLSAKLP